ncbi:homeobox-leucine zipper protein PROTODERMAL FACTOR 2-like isoform X1 [Salvia miltiorrhiza]|uniref:homeobox-leucine zipper protein PROTODERMAL FACTOR 2-like isoform X1 n=1 Tax=Salvia miltiorrhiza TaxID=226208 RepID=UPI0025AC7834|nr:homeobox-leucine zipper protein PROTODERMAL FACTOR 2-like isoform X1 [Salvia miltiorrhiza]
MAVCDKLGLKHNMINDYDGQYVSNREAATAADDCMHPSFSMPNAYCRADVHFQSLHDYSNNMQRASDLLVAVSSSAEVHKERILDLAFSASEELRIVAQEQQSLWLFDIDNGCEVLNQAEYKRRFESFDPNLEEVIRLISGGKPYDLPDLNENIESCTTQKMNSESSRANGVVFREPVWLVSMFMDVDKWSAAFSNVVSKAINLAVLNTGNKEIANGCVQVMYAEFHNCSPLIKPRQMYFVRQSRQIDANTWVVADISLETIYPNPVLTSQRKPSGCVIQALQDGISTVTWVEHNAECNGFAHSMFKGLLESGVVYNAKRWMSTLERQCDRIATLEAQDDSLNDEGPGAARNSLLKLAERMIRHFNFNIFSNMESAWRAVNLPGADEILIKTSFNLDDLQIPCPVVVSIATSVWLPVKQIQVFNFLRNEHNRAKWDILSHGLEVQDVVRVSSARNSTDSVSVVSVGSCSKRGAITYLQESYSDSVACYLVYAPIDVPTMHRILQGGSADSVAILPSGLVVLPDGSSTQNSILTLAFQVIEEELTTPQELPTSSLITACTLINETVSLIRTALLLEA